MTDVAVVGAGLTGSLLACFLARRGHTVTVYERRPDPRTTGAERGRSINLALSERGIDALRRIGLAERVLVDALPMRGRMIHPVAGEVDFQQYSFDGRRAINSIGRGALNNALLDAASATAGVTILFEHRLTGLDPLVFATPGGEVKAAPDVVIGADGAGSAVRGRLLGMGLLDESVELLDHGYKELTIAAGPDGDFALDPGALHIWPRGTSMMIALPNPDRTFTCTLFWPNGGTSSFASLGSPAAIERHFRSVYPDVVGLMPNLVDDYRLNPVGQLATVRCGPWQAATPGGPVGLIGDAAHAIVPFYGQGANCGFEDCVVLDRVLDATGDDFAAALPAFEARRRADVEAIATMALDNFVEMRDKVASPVFRLGKRIEHALERALPGRYVSRYELVSFSTTPYAKVRDRVRRQHQLLGVAGVLALGAVAAAIPAAVKGWRR
jgi:kynurenine 3-monooxygenase